MNPLKEAHHTIKATIERRSMHYARAWNIDGVPLPIDEFISKGWEICAEALETYDPGRGAAFTSYLWHRLGKLKDTAEKEQRHLKATASRDTLLETVLVLGMASLALAEGLFLDDLSPDARELVETLLARGLHRGRHPTARTMAIQLEWPLGRTEDAWEEAQCWVKFGGKPYNRREVQC